MEDLTKVQEELAAERSKNAVLESAFQELSDTHEALLAEKAVSKTSVTSTVQRAILPETTFKVAKAEYRFIVPSFTHDGTKWTAVEALKDKTLLDELVKGEFGVIEKTK